MVAAPDCLDVEIITKSFDVKIITSH